MEIRQLEAFAAVHASGSVTAAARELDRSQPVVSRQLQDLEHELGFTLFARTRPQVTLTEQGRLFLEEVRSVLAGLQQLEVRSREIAGGATRPVRIAATFSLGISLLPAALADFRDAPLFDREVHVEVMSPDQIVEKLLDGDIDVAFACLPLELGRCRLHWCAQAACQVALPASHPLARESVVSPVQLVNERLITLSNASRMRHRLSTALLHPSRPPGEKLMVTESTLSAVMMAGAGLGVALVDPCVAQHIRPAGVVYKPLDSYVPYMFGAITLGERPPTEALRQIIDGVHAYAFREIPNLATGDLTGVPVLADPLDSSSHSDLISSVADAQRLSSSF